MVETHTGPSEALRGAAGTNVPEQKIELVAKLQSKCKTLMLICAFLMLVHSHIHQHMPGICKMKITISREKYGTEKSGTKGCQNYILNTAWNKRPYLEHWQLCNCELLQWM
mmetsp:Transcript_136909/g.237911  ORF Transcript_136909/g.237911 Transcript_136909/m.237911 type:complete len:111 (-) Transcript_136909:834-1166(-)